MYSYQGRRLVNQVLAGNEASLGTHIAFGINVVYDASIQGNTYPFTHNTYHSPYIVDEITISNSSLTSGANGDQIKFAGQADVSNKYIANNVALVRKRANAAVNEQRKIANAELASNAVGAIGWVGTNLTVPDVNTQFTNAGMVEVPANTNAVFNGSFSLYQSSAEDIIAIPMYFISGTSLLANPTGIVVNLSINFTKNDVAQSLTYRGTVAAGYKFSHDSSNNTVTSVGTVDKPNPFLLQRRLRDFSASTNGMTVADLIANGRNITGLTITSTNAMRFGSTILTPDFNSDTGRITTAFRKLATPLYKTDSESYTNAEFSLAGVL